MPLPRDLPRPSLRPVPQPPVLVSELSATVAEGLAAISSMSPPGLGVARAVIDEVVQRTTACASMTWRGIEAVRTWSSSEPD